MAVNVSGIYFKSEFYIIFFHLYLSIAFHFFKRSKFREGYNGATKIPNTKAAKFFYYFLEISSFYYLLYEQALTNLFFNLACWTLVQ